MAERRIAGTSEVYDGKVVKLGEFEYTTVGGGIEGDRQQLEPMESTDEEVISTPTQDSPITDFVFLEDYDVGTNDGVLTVADAIYWNELERNDIAQFIQQFIASQNFPPNRPVQGGQADEQIINQEQPGLPENGEMGAPPLTGGMDNTGGGNTGGGPSY